MDSSNLGKVKRIMEDCTPFRYQVCVLKLALVLTLVVYMFPVLVVRPTLWYGPVDLDLKARILMAAEEMDDGPLVANSGRNGPKVSEIAKKLTPEDLLQYERDGYYIVRDAIELKHVDVLRDLFEHLQQTRNLQTKFMDTLSCTSYLFEIERVVPEFAALIFRLNLHWVAQRLLKQTVLMNSILHYNSRDCGFVGSALSTHNDYFSLPYSIERMDSSSFFGDNGYVVKEKVVKALHHHFLCAQSCRMGCGG